MDIDEPHSPAGYEAGDTGQPGQIDGLAGVEPGPGPDQGLLFATWPSPRPSYHLTVDSTYPTLEAITKAVQDEAEKAGFGAVRKRVNYYPGPGPKVACRVDFRCHCSGIPNLNVFLLQIANIYVPQVNISLLDGPRPQALPDGLTVPGNL